jgi:hypothetical protein
VTANPRNLPMYASRHEWKQLGLAPVRRAPYIVEHGRRVYACWFVEAASTTRRAPA